MRWFLWLLIFCSTVHANPRFDNGTSYLWEGFEVRLTHFELARKEPVVFVHFQVKNFSSEDKICHWKELVTLVEAGGDRLSSNYDALVDLGNGLTRTVGPFTVPARRRVKISVPFLLQRENLPAVLELPDGRRSAPLLPRPH